MKSFTKILSVVFIIYLLTSCKTAKIQQYFRTYDNESLRYKFKRDSLGIISYYDDTLTCRIVVRRGVFWKRYDKNFDVFYFDKSNVPNSSEKENPFYDFAFCFDKGNLYGGKSLSISMNPMFYSKMKLIIPSKVSKGDSAVFIGSDYKSVFTFIDFEDFEWHKLGIQNV